MPMYEYQCRECGHQFTKLIRGMNGKDSVSCPECGDSSPRRLISGFASVSSAKSTGSGCSAKGGFT